MSLKQVLIDALRNWSKTEIGLSVPRQMFESAKSSITLYRNENDQIICEAYCHNIGDIDQRTTPVTVKVLDFPSA